MESVDAAQESILLSQEEGEALTPAMERNNNVDGPIEMVRKVYAEGGGWAFFGAALKNACCIGDQPLPFSCPCIAKSVKIFFNRDDIVLV